jgi:hypothetical protein
MRVLFFVFLAFCQCFATESEPTTTVESPLVKKQHNTKVSQNLERIADFSLRLHRLSLMPDRDYQSYKHSIWDETTQKSIVPEDKKGTQNEQKVLAHSDIEQVKGEIDTLYQSLIPSDVDLQYQQFDALGFKHDAIIISPKSLKVKNVIYYVHGGPGLFISDPENLSGFMEDLISHDQNINFNTISTGWNRVFNVLSIASEFAKEGYAFVFLNFPCLSYQNSKFDQSYAQMDEYTKITKNVDNTPYTIGKHMMPYIYEQLKNVQPFYNQHFGLKPDAKNIYWGHSFGGEIGHQMIVDKNYKKYMEDNFSKIILAMPTVSYPSNAPHRKYDFLDVQDSIYNSLLTLGKFNVPVTFIVAKKDTNVIPEEVISLYATFKEGQEKVGNGHAVSLIRVRGDHGAYSPISIAKDFIDEKMDGEKKRGQIGWFNDKYDKALDWDYERYLRNQDLALSQDPKNMKSEDLNWITMRLLAGEENVFSTFQTVFDNPDNEAGVTVFDKEIREKYMIYDEFVGVIRGILNAPN